MELRALWDVSQQFQNKNGSINASGKIFVYFLGRTALATTYTSEDGNVVNSNPILLDNNGRATCYADTKYSYTVVVCDFYGKELFSYDITLHDAISTVEDVIILGSDGTVLVDETQLPNGVQYDLSVNTDIFATNADLQATSAILQEEIDQNTIDISAISAALPDKKDKQSELIYGGNTTMTITKIKQNENGEITEVRYEPIDLPPEVPNVEIISPSGTVNVTSVTDTSTNTKTFELDVNQRDPFWHYWTGNNAWTKIYNGIWKEINRPAIGAGSQPHTWNPTITRGVWDAKAHFTVTFHNENENHVIPNDKLQIGFRAKLVGQNNPSAVNYIDLGAWVYDPSLYTTEWYQYNFAQESIRQNFDTSLIMNVANYFGDSAFDVYFEAKLLNTDGGPDATVTPIDQDICRVEITYFGIHEICNVNGTVTINNVTGSNYAEGWGININDNIISVDPTIIPEVSAFATETELAEVSANIISQIPESQVQSNWTETDDADPSFIQNKPEEIQLIAGTNVAITTSGNSAIISASGSGDVTEAELAEVSATLHTEIVNVSANIPEQVQSNWTETDNTDPSYIQNKPAEKNLVAGDNISMTVSGDNVIISSTASGDVMMSDLVNVSGNLQTEIINVSSTLQAEIINVTSNLPEQVQSNWTEADDTDPSYIQNKPEEIIVVPGANITITTSGNSAIISSTASGGSTYTAGDGIDITSDVISVDGTIARKTEVANVSGTLHTEIQAVSAAIPTVTPQVQSNWTEDDDSDPSYIQNKPSEQSLVAGNGINLTSSGNTVTISAEVPTVTGFATEAQLQSVSGTLQDEIDNLPTPVEYSAGDGINITNNVISVDNTVAMASALPTTETGKFTIQSNVSGGPIQVICPTDEGFLTETVILDNDAVSGISGSSSTVYIVYKSPGYDDNYYSVSGPAVLHVPEAINGVYSILIQYASNNNPLSSGPNLTTTIYGDSNYILAAGDYNLTAIANSASGGYGKYITIIASGPAPAASALLKSSFSLYVRNPQMGISVNLDRYYLGNTSTTTSNSLPQAVIYTDPTTKKQTVFMPNAMPDSWYPSIITSLQYGSNYNAPSSIGFNNKQFRAYKSTSYPIRYQFAYLTDWDYPHSTMSFISYDNSGNAIEKWTLNYTNYSSNVWTTTPISSGSTYTAGNGIDITNDVISVDSAAYIPYSASGVYLPNSKFEIDTEGQAYKVITPEIESNYNYFSDYGILFYTGVGAQLGTYKAILPSNVASIRISNNGGNDVTGTYDIATHTAILNVNALVGSNDTYVYAYDSNNSFVALSSSNTTVKYVVPGVTEEYITDGDLELNADNQVIAIDGYDLAGGGASSYTAGNGIDITSDVISVDNTVALKTDIPVVSGFVTQTELISVSGTLQSEIATVSAAIPDTSDLVTKSELATVEAEIPVVTGFATKTELQTVSGNIPTSIDSLVTANITDIQVVQALPGSPVATVLYLIPEA